MQPLVLLPVLLSLASANIMNNILLNVLTQGMDPITKSIMKSTIGAEFLDMESGNSGSGSSSGMGGMEGLLGGMSNLLSSQMLNSQQFRSPFGGSSYGGSPYGGSPYGNSRYGSGFSPKQPAFTSHNIITPSAINPYKGRNPYNSRPVNSVSTSLASPAATVSSNANASPGGMMSSISSPANPTPTLTSFSSGTMGLSPFSSMRSRQSNFYQRFMMWRMMDMMDFF